MAYTTSKKFNKIIHATRKSYKESLCISSGSWRLEVGGWKIIHGAFVIPTEEFDDERRDPSTLLGMTKL